MGIPFCLAAFIAFCIFLAVRRNSTLKKEKQIHENFWEKEEAANAVRRQSLDSLSYIIIPVNKLPFMDTDNEAINTAQNTVKSLVGKKIVNLTGISNTDLKLEYGAPNLPELTLYDENFTQLARALYSWGQALSEAGYTDEAITVLEFGVTCKTDISKNYTLLAQLYKFTDDPSKIYTLVLSAEEMPSSRKETVIKDIKKIMTA